MSQHKCQNCGGSLLQKVLETGVTGICQPCGLIYSIANSVTNSPKVPQEIRNLTGVVSTVLLILGGAYLLNKAIKG